MRAAARATNVYVVVAMLLAACAGRLLDTAGLLPGVHETVAVRGGGAGWLTAMLAAAFVAQRAARRWHLSGDLAATARTSALGQLAVFFTAEAVVRLANGRFPFDPDALVGAAVQAGLAAVLLLALLAATHVAQHCSSLRAATFPVPSARFRRRLIRPIRTRPVLALHLRGPPQAAGF